MCHTVPGTVVIWHDNYSSWPPKEKKFNVTKLKFKLMILW